jgi:hypothetical protein
MIGRKGSHADDSAIDPQAAQAAGEAEQSSRDAGLSAEAGGLYARLHHDPEEAELGAS